MSDDSLPFLPQIVGVLEQERIAYALIGAFAMVAHRVGRATFDVDFLTTDSRVLKIDWAALIGKDIPVEARRGEHDDPLAGVVRFAPEGQMSFDLVIGKWKWQREIVERADRFDVRGTTLPVAGLADLCLLKINTGGYQDTRDAAMMLERYPSIDQELRQRLETLPSDLREACVSFLAAHSA